jgi:hypothetical protein
MNIELIILGVVWLIATEVIYFRFYMNSSEFIESKIGSMCAGFFIAVGLFGFPAFLANMTSIVDGNILYGDIVYLWYYGIVISVSLFFGINYAIYSSLEARKR